METQQELLLIIKSILNKSDSRVSNIDDMGKLVSLARRHNVLSYLAVFMEHNMGLFEQDAKAVGYIKAQNTKQVAQCVHQIYALDEMRNAFEEEHIYNMPLKGSCTNRLYPDESLRPMGDIDILFKAEQGKKVRRVMEKLGYSDFEEGRKHDKYHRKPFVCVEAHRELVAARSEFASYYENIWNICTPKCGYSYSFEMEVEDEFIFNIIHLIGHLKEGGAGIRFIMDIYMYDRIDMDRDYLEDELEKLGIFEFYRNVSQLAKYWFGDDTVELEQNQRDLMEKLGTFIMSNDMSEVCDNSSNLAVSDGRWSFALRVCFPSYYEMCTMFPWLKGRPFLLPYSWCLRGVRSVKNRPENVRQQISRFRNGNASKGRELERFYAECGLGK